MPGLCLPAWGGELGVSLEQVREAAVGKSAAALEKAGVLKHSKGEEKGEERKT